MVLWPMYQNQLELLASFAGRLGEYLVHCSLSVIKCRGVRKMLTHRQNHPVLVWSARQQRLTVHRYKYLYSIYPFWGACIFPSIFSGFLISHSSIVKFESPWHNVLRWDGQRMLCATPEKDACALHAPTCSLSRRQWSYEWWCVLYMYCNSNSHDNKWIQMTILYTYYLSSKIHQ